MQDNRKYPKNIIKPYPFYKWFGVCCRFCPFGIEFGSLWFHWNGSL